MAIFVSIDLKNPRFNVYMLSYWLWERLNGKKGTFVRRLPLDSPSPLRRPSFAKISDPPLVHV